MRKTFPLSYIATQAGTADPPVRACSYAGPGPRLGRVMSNKIIYRRNIVPRWPRVVCAVILAGLAVVMPIVQPSSGDVPFIVDSAVYTLLWGIPVWVALFAMWSIDRSGRTTVTSDELRVGRLRVPVGDIERASVVQLARQSPDLWRRLVASSGQIDYEALRFRDTGEPPILGGARATPLGADAITVTLRGQGPVLIPTADRDGLVSALLEVVPADD